MISDESSSRTVLITALREVLHFTYYSYLIDLLIFFRLRLFSVDWFYGTKMIISLMSPRLQLTLKLTRWMNCSDSSFTLDLLMQLLCARLNWSWELDSDQTLGLIGVAVVDRKLQVWSLCGCESTRSSALCLQHELCVCWAAFFCKQQKAS